MKKWMLLLFALLFAGVMSVECRADDGADNETEKTQTSEKSEKKEKKEKKGKKKNSKKANLKCLVE